MSESATPFDLFRNIRTMCSNNIKFDTKAIPDRLWESVNVFGLLPNFVGVPPIGLSLIHI